jgi:hypothetical protein
MIAAMFKDTATFAKMAGMKVADFTDLLNKDANEAFIKVLQGAKGTSGGFAEMAKNLDAMGLDGARSTGVLGVLANNIDKLRERQAFANDEFEKGTSLTEEFNTKNETAQAQLEKSRKEVTRLAVELGEKLNPYMTLTNVGFSKFLRLIMGAPAWLKENQMLLIALAGAVLVYNQRLIASTALTLKDKAVKLGALAVEKASIAAKVAHGMALNAYTAATGKATMAQKRLIVAARQTTAAFAINPFGALILGITALVLAIKGYDKYSEQAVKRQIEKKQAVDNLSEANKSLKATYENLNIQIGNLSRLSVQEKKDLQDKILLTLSQAEAELELQKAKQQQVKESNTKTTLWDDFINGFKAMAKTATGDFKYYDQLGAADALKNGTEAAAEMNDGIKDLEQQLEALRQRKFDLDEILNAENIGDSIGSETLTQLEEKLGKYQTALKNVAAGGEDYLRIQQKIADTQKLIAKYQPENADTGDALSKEEQKKLDKLKEDKKKAEADLAKAILDIRRQLKLDTLSEEDQELQKIKYKYADLLATAEQYGLDTLQLKELEQKELTAVVVNYEVLRTKARQDAEAKIADIMASDREHAVKATTQKYTDLIKLAEDNGLATTELYRRMNEELAIIADERFGDEADIFGMTQDDWDNMLKNFDLAMQAIGEIGSIWGSMNQIANNKDQRAFNQYEKNTKQKKELLADQLDKGLIKQEEYNARISQLDADLDKKKAELNRKQAERDKKLKIFQAVTSTAMGVVNAIAQAHLFPFNFVLGALVAAAGIAQVAAITSEPLPEYIDGGYNGFTKGDGIYTSSSGRPFRAGERNKREWIGSNHMLTNPYTGPIIATLENVQRGRVPASIFADAINPPAFKTMTASMPQYAKGGYNGTSTGTQTVVQQGIDITPLVIGINTLIDKTTQLTNFMSDPKNRQAYITDKTLKTYNKEDAERNTLARMQ